MILSRLEEACEAGIARPIDVEFARFIKRRWPESHEATIAAAYLVSRAVGEANTCVLLENINLDNYEEFNGINGISPEMMQKQLTNSDAVKTGREMQGLLKPLVFEDGRLYLHRYFDYERRLSNMLLARAVFPPAGPEPDHARSVLEQFFSKSGTEPDWQEIAAAQSLYRKLLIISGGPGTGKTWTVTAMIAAMLQLNDAPVISLAAPTGKAAARLTESVRTALQTIELPAGTVEKFPREACTIHRLLGAGFRPGRYRHGRENPITADVLIVDEASMIDLPIMVRLMEALRDETMLVLLGDRDQLASVEAGSVLHDICSGMEHYGYSETFFQLAGTVANKDAGMVKKTCYPETAPLRDCIVELTHNYRFKQGGSIGLLAMAVNAGDASAALDILRDRKRPEVTLIDPSSMAIESLVEKYIVPHAVKVLKASSAGEALSLFPGIQALCAIRQGPVGMDRINDLVAMYIAHLEGMHTHDALFRGLPVIMERNEYAAGVYNGDIGMVWQGKGKSGRLKAFFEGAGGNAREISISRLPAYQPAWAITIHRSQGSEYGKVLCILPGNDSRIIGRELLYTAITRARDSVLIWADDITLEKYIRGRAVRHSGLSRRLWGGL